jgi:acyl carrier protein
MNAKQELLARLQQIISEQLGVQQEEITGKSSWAQLGADSLDRLGMSQAIEAAFDVDIPHSVGERLNTVAETTEHLLTLIAARKDASNIRIEAMASDQQWGEVAAVRTQVFKREYGFSFEPLPGPGETGMWHFVARDNRGVIGTLSVVDTTGDRQVHQRYLLSFGENERVARYAQLAVLKPYRKCGISRKLIETAQNTVIRPNGFAVEWLLYPAAHTRSSMLTKDLGFIPEAPLLATEFGSCHALIRRESRLPQINGTEESFPVLTTCPV